MSRKSELVESLPSEEEGAGQKRRDLREREALSVIMSKRSYEVACLCAMLVLAMVMGGKEVAVQAAPAPAAAAPAPAIDCDAVIFTMTDCLGYVTGMDKKPASACCTELSTVVNNSPQCLCQLFNTTLTGPLNVNLTIAQQLPAQCKVQTPPTSLCAELGVPVPGPVGAVSPSAVAPASAAPGPPVSVTGVPPTGSTAPAVPAASTATNNTSAPGPSSAPGALLHGAVPAIAATIVYLVLA